MALASGMALAPPALPRSQIAVKNSRTGNLSENRLIAAPESEDATNNWMFMPFNSESAGNTSS